MKNTSTNTRRESRLFLADFFSWAAYKQTMKKHLFICLAFVGFLAFTTVAQAAITISQQPTDIYTTPSRTATFSVVATSSPPAGLSFQWSRNGAPIANATNASTIRAAYNDGTRDLIVLEAEHFDKNTPGAGQSWVFTTVPPFLLSTATDTNFSGSGSMVQPNTLAGFTYNVGDKPTDNPQLDYAVYFPAAGDYHVWVRGAGDSDVGGVHDSVNFGVDGVLAYRINGVYPQSGGYVWGDAATPVGAVLSVSTPGLHVFNLWQREDSFAVDKIVITQDLGYTPTGVGPAESPLLSGTATSSYTTRVLNAGDLGTNLYSVRVSAGASFVNSDTVSLVVTSSFVPSTFYSRAVFNDQPLTYWSFDEAGPTDNAKQQMDVPQGDTIVNDLVPAFGATRVAHSVAVNSPFLLGNAGEFYDGVSGNIGNFNAPSPNFGQPDMPGPYAVEYWVQVLPAPQTGPVLISVKPGGDFQFNYDGGPSANTLEIYAGGFPQRTLNLGWQIVRNVDTNWHHVLWVYYGNVRSSTNKLDTYMDGMLKSNLLSGFDQSLTLNQAITVGDYRPGGGAGFPGRLDEVAFYDLSRYTNLSEAQFSARISALVGDHELAATINAGGVSISITQQPADTAGFVGGTTNFTVAAMVSGGGAGPLMYQWQKDWQNIPGATNATYTTPTLTGGDSGAIFRARVSSGNVFAYSRESALTVQGFTITISQQPTNASATVGATATFSVVATSSPVVQLSYQWKKNGANIFDATNSSYTTPALQLGDTGTNLYRVRVSAGASFVDSDEAALVVATPPVPNTHYSQVVSNDAPLLYWNFDEATGNAIQQMPVPSSPTTVNDLVPAFAVRRVAHSTIGSGLLLGYSGDFNRSLKSLFSVAAPNAGVASIDAPYAVEFWLQALPGPADQAIVSFTPGGNFTFGYNNPPAPNYLEIYGGSSVNRTLSSGVSIVNGVDTNWHHVVWVFYGGLRPSTKLDVYLDGVRKSNLLNDYDLPLILNQTITVGDYNPIAGAGFNGRIDELAVYDWSAFSDETTLANHANDMVSRHFAAALPVSTTLSFTRNGSNLTLSWTGNGFTLQEAQSLSSPTWADVSGGNTSPVTVSIGTVNKFYRLRKP